MIIERVTDISIIDEIKEYFIEEHGYTRDICAAELKEVFSRPDSERLICVIVAKEDDIIEGYVVGVIIYDRCFIVQAYSKATRMYSDYGFEMLKAWAWTAGAKELRLECESDSAITRFAKLGFNKCSTIMRLEI